MSVLLLLLQIFATLQLLLSISAEPVGNRYMTIGNKKSRLNRHATAPFCAKEMFAFEVMCC